MKKIIYILLVVLMTASCEKVIEFKGEKTAPMLVVNSIIAADSTITMEVTESRFFLSDDNSMKHIENADIKLIVNGKYKEKLMKLSPAGTYGSAYKVSAGDEIKIEASTPGLPAVTATTKLPIKPIVLNVDTVSTTIISYQMEKSSLEQLEEDTVGEYRLKNIKFKMKFKDNGDEKNYYRLIVKKRTYYEKMNQLSGFWDDRGYHEEQITHFEDIVFENSNQVGDWESIFEDDEKTYFYDTFSDDLINGQEYELKFSDEIVQNHFYYDKNRKAHNPEKTVYLIYLQELSTDYYLYIRSSVSAERVAENPFVEPVQIRSNVENGIGILGSYTSSAPYVVEFKH
ncbi:MAG: DUF4249 domain-containing protein [Bacteroidales bacterium]|mgnify:CR=1 FL=1|nr:DUF4249 domain-containing protein [Bacteroidales bacterium]